LVNCRENQASASAWTCPTSMVTRTVLGERFAGGECLPDTFGKGVALVRTGQPIGGNRRADPAEQFVEAELTVVLDGHFPHTVEARRPKRLGIPQPITAAGAAGRCERGAHPVFEATAQSPGPGTVLQPQRRAVRDHRDAPARTQERCRGAEELIVPHPVERLADDHQRRRPLSQQPAQRREIGIGTEHPGHVPNPLGLRRAPGQPQHVRLRIHPHHRTNPGGEGKSELAGATPHVEHDIGAREPEGVRQGVEDLRRVPTPELRVVLGHSTAESHCHGPTVPGARRTGHLAHRAIALRGIRGRAELRARRLRI
jgi:hypothetical protein